MKNETMRHPVLPNREIHVDFHTSGLIPGVGAEFNPKEFAETLAAAGVTAACLFTRGHHGWCTYPTQVGEQHPDLRVSDLLGEQYRALQEVDIVPSLYTTVCWDELQVARHPEWICKRENGQIMKMNPLTGSALGMFEPGWTFLCWNSPYREYVKAQSVEAVLRHPDSDYLFVDILFNDEPCCCQHCTDRMKAHGLNPENPADREKNSLDSAREFMEFLNQAVHEAVPGMPMFYNSRLRVTGAVENGSKPELQYLGVTIVESLPSGPWGYDHFPIFARYFQNFPNKMMGHTGKFQKMWGDFGGLKNQAALDYEVIRMMAFGVVASIGDQLPPSGKFDKATYELIGNTYRKVSQVEKHLMGSTPIDEIAVLLTDKEVRVFDSKLDAEYGAMKMLTQRQYQFSFIDVEADFSSYAVVILPDDILVDAILLEKLENYLQKGGKILASYKSGVSSEGVWNLKTLPIIMRGDNPFTPYYIYPVDKLLKDGLIEDTDHVQYLGGALVEVAAAQKEAAAVEVLAKVTEPYFNREWDHFCSHLQTPPAKKTQYPEMLFNGSNMVYFAAKKFACYNNFASHVDRNMVEYGLSLLLEGGKLVESNLPSTAEVTLRRSRIEDAPLVLTVMHYIPQRRTQQIDIIEDTIPLYDIDFSVKTGGILSGSVSSVVDASTGESLSFTQKEERVNFSVGKINGFRVFLIR